MKILLFGCADLQLSMGAMLIRILVQKQPPEVPYKKVFLKISQKFTGKHLCQSLFFNKVLQL